MKRSRCLILLTALFMISIISGLGMVVTPAAASTTTYTGNGNSRTMLERANRLWSASVSSNETLFQPTLPGNDWGGYQLSTAFTNIARNTDYVANGQFTGSPNPPWSYDESGDTSYLLGGFSNPPSQGGTTTGSDYLRLQGRTTQLGPAGFPQVLYNMNFSTSPASQNDWNVSKVVLGTPGYGTFTSQWVGNPDYVWEEKGTFSNTGSSMTVYADMYCDQNFTYSGSVLPLMATLGYKTWASAYSLSGNGQLRIRLILSYFPTPSTSKNYTILDWTPTSQGTKPTGNTFYDMTSLLNSTGKYRVRLWTYTTMTVGKNKVSTLAARWDDVGIYIAYDKLSTGSIARWGEQFNFGQYAAADGQLSFKYYTNLTTIVPSTDSYLSAWVIGSSSNRYDIKAFSSIATGSWRLATVAIPASVFNNSAQITIKIGVLIGSNLLIATGINPRIYFDNVTFFAKYKPTPSSIKLGIYDDVSGSSAKWNIATGTYGSGTLLINASTPWSGASATFHFLTNGTNGKASYNSSIVTFSYASTMYAMNWTLTRSPTFAVHDDTNAAWYCNYTTPNSIGGYSNYNVSVYVPPDWIQGGRVDTVKYGTTSVTDYTAISVNSSTWVIKIPGSDFPSLGYLLEVWATSPNYLGPSGARVLLYTQGNKTNSPGPSDWRNSTYFLPENITRLVGLVRNASNGIPGSVDSSQATVKLYNASKSSSTPLKTWLATPNSTGHILLQLGSWSALNATWWNGTKQLATSWFFEVQWNNLHEAANGIVYFTTNNTVSALVQTSLTAPKAPYVVPYGDGFTLVTIYNNIQNGSGIQGATVNWRWVGQSNTSQMTMTPTIRGNYTASISADTSALRYGLSTIQVNATLSGYVTQTINITVTVRDIVTAGSASSFVVPYQAYAWNATVQTSLTYQDADHNFQGITGATLYANSTCVNGTMIGSSGIKWWYDDLGGGSYAIFFNATASTPTGTHSWTFTIKATKTHYQETSFNLNGFNIRDRSTTHTEPSLSVTKPWGDTAIFLITYRDADATGSPIIGAAATTTWPYPYTMTPLGNGTYEFSLSLVGLAPQTSSFSFGLSKSHFASIDTIGAQVVIRSINTGLSSPKNTITAYWGNNQTAELIYRDLDHNLNISIASWTVLAYDKQTGFNYSGSLVYNIYVNSLHNSWYIRVNGSLPVGDYTLWIHAYVQTSNGYDDKWLYPTLSIRSIPAGLVQQSGTALTVVWRDSGKIVVSYTDTNHSVPISGASVGLLIDPIISWSAYENESGIYTIFLDTSEVQGAPSFYVIVVQLSKGNYTTATKLLPNPLYIAPIATGIDITPPQVVSKGLPANYTVSYWDVSHNRPVLSANITLVGVDPSHYSVLELGNGSYAVVLQTDWISENQTLVFTIIASKANYSPQQSLITFKFPTGGFSLMTVILVGTSSSGAVVLLALGYIMYRRAKRPFVIKKIEQSLKLINKGAQAEPVEGLRNRTDIPLALLTTDFETLGVKIGREEPKGKENKQGKSRNKKSEKKEAKPEEGSKDSKTSEGGT